MEPGHQDIDLWGYASGLLALMSKNEVLLQEYVTQAYAIAPLFLQNRGVEIWPSAYLDTDKPDTYRLERQWQIDICHRVYKTKCYFAIMPHYKDYTYPVPVKDEAGQVIGQQERMFSMDQKTFLGQNYIIMFLLILMEGRLNMG